MSESLKGTLVASKEYDSSEPVTLRFELANTGDQDVYVLKWFTPLEGLSSDCLTVIRNEKSKVPYDGPMIKRGRPSPEDYLLVPAHGKVAAEVNVSEAYQVSTPGEYRVELDIRTLEHLPVPEPGKHGAEFALQKSAPQTQSVTGGRTKFKVRKGPIQIPTRGQAARTLSKALAKSAGPPASSTGAVGAAAAPLPPTFVGGTPAQQALVKQAHEDGFKLCEAALAAIADDDRYKEWFGAYTAARSKKVKGVFTKIRDQMKTVAYTYDLTGAGCKSGAYAYTYKGSTTIWLCGGFWNAPANGSDSKAGTIVHEHSHSDANTDDVTYGQANSRNLAAKKPDDAVRNADNFEYYAGG